MKPLLAKAEKDDDFRKHLLANPKKAIEEAFGVTLAKDHKIHVHAETDTNTHLVIPPKSKLSAEEREAAKTGTASLEFLKKTMYDPAPPKRAPQPRISSVDSASPTPDALIRAGRESIRRGLEFLETSIDQNGAWHCVRYNIADAKIPRHFEKPAFVSAYCVLALEGCKEPIARRLCARSQEYIVDTMEYPGLWRYYRHLPQDLDSSTLCSLVIGSHPWMLLERNLPAMLENRDENGCFLTWILAEDEPDVVSTFRVEADPVVNANVIAYLGDRKETKAAQAWLEKLIIKGSIAGSSKWYPDKVSIYYATTRAMLRARPALNRLQAVLPEQIRGLASEDGEFDNILQTAQAISALYNIGDLGPADAERYLNQFLLAQSEDGCWPELLAYGDQFLKWGAVGQIGHASESVTTAFCIEALERLVEVCEIDRASTTPLKNG